MAAEDNFSADTNGERRCGLLGGDGDDDFFCLDSLRLFDEFSSLADVFLSDFAFLSGDSFLDFFADVFSDELAGLPLFLMKRR